MIIFIKKVIMLIPAMVEFLIKESKEYNQGWQSSNAKLLRMISWYPLVLLSVAGIVAGIVLPFSGWDGSATISQLVVFGGLFDLWFACAVVFGLSYNYIEKYESD